MPLKRGYLAGPPWRCQLPQLAPAWEGPTIIAPVPPRRSATVKIDAATFFFCFLDLEVFTFGFIGCVLSEGFGLYQPLTVNNFRVGVSSLVLMKIEGIDEFETGEQAMSLPVEPRK